MILIYDLYTYYVLNMYIYISEYLEYDKNTDNALFFIRYNRRASLINQ